MINLLSVDWDYFIATTAEQRAFLLSNRDNEDFTQNGQALIWSRRYAESSIGKEFCGQNNIRDIQVLDEQIAALYALVENCKKPDTKISLYESHEEIADIIARDFESSDVINLYNLGFHHESNTESKINQINSDLQNLHDNPDTLTKGIDHIFLCRSIMRTPPHLDNDYKKMVEQLNNLLGLGMVYRSSRWTIQKQREIEYMVTQRLIIYSCYTELQKRLEMDGIDNQGTWMEHIKEAQDRLNKMHQDNLSVYRWAGSFSSDE